MRWTLDDLITHYLAYLEGQGRELCTRIRYEGVAKLWISPAIGSKAARRISADDIDRCFAEMRRAGQSASSMNQAKALLSAAFKWARRTGKAIHNPLLDFQMPKSRHVQREKLPPEADEISLILRTAWEQTPDIAPILTLAATTGARLGELVAPRASDIDWDRGTLAITAAADLDGSLKETKRAQHRREVPLDAGTVEVLRRQVENASTRAVFFDIPTPEDPFLFSLEGDSSRPRMPGYVTKRLQVQKGHLGVEDKHPETIALEDEALRLRRFGASTRSARRGPPPTNGSAFSYDEVGRILERSQMWAQRACDAAERRHKASVQPFVQRVSEVHLERATRCRIQPQRGRTTARTQSGDSDQALQQGSVVSAPQGC
jgi:integrase